MSHDKIIPNEADVMRLTGHPMPPGAVYVDLNAGLICRNKGNTSEAEIESRP